MHTHGIMYHNKTHLLITQKQHDDIYTASTTGQVGIWLNGMQNYVPFGSIADVCPLSEFYGKYPNARPAETNQHSLLPEHTVKTYMKRETPLRGMIDGLKGRIKIFEQSGYDPKGARELLEKMEIKLARMVNGQKTSDINII